MNILKKPPHISENVWRQHISWMQVLKEGSLTGKKPTSTGSNSLPESSNKYRK